MHMINHDLCQNEAENHSIEPSMSSESKTACASSDSTSEIKTDSTGSEWIDIGGVKKWVRHCPTCGASIFHGRKDHRDAQRRKGSTCQVCAHKKLEVYIVPSDLTRACPSCGRLVTYGGKTSTTRKRTYLKSVRENRVCCDCAQRVRIEKIKYSRRGTVGPNLGRKYTDAEKLRFREMKRGKPGPRSGMKTPESTKEKLRVAGVKRRMLLGHIGYNPRACDYIDGISKLTGWNLQHAKKVGEYSVLGYLLDGYDAAHNVVFEYDESWHYRYGELLEKDVDRMRKIIQHLNCRFIRYNEKANELYECRIDHDNSSQLQYTKLSLESISLNSKVLPK